MPLYDYSCANCGFEFEESRTIADRKTPETEPCPECKAPSAVTQMVGGPFIGDSVRMGFTKPNTGFQKRLRDIQEKYNGGKITGTHGHNRLEY